MDPGRKSKFKHKIGKAKESLVACTVLQFVTSNFPYRILGPVLGKVKVGQIRTTNLRAMLASPENVLDHGIRLTIKPAISTMVPTTTATRNAPSERSIP